MQKWYPPATRHSVLRDMDVIPWARQIYSASFWITIGEGCLKGVERVYDLQGDDTMASNKNTFQQLYDYDQRPWIDFISHELLESGQLKELAEICRLFQPVN